MLKKQFDLDYDKCREHVREGCTANRSSRFVPRSTVSPDIVE